MRPFVLLTAATALALVAPLVVEGVSSAATEPKIVSGALPGGGKFTLPAPPAAPFPVPASATGVSGGKPAPATIEDAPGYRPQTSCDPVEKPGISAFKKLVLAQYPAGTDWGSVRNCTDDGISEHLEGRAWDWHVDANNAASFASAANVLSWLTKNNGYQARRLGIMYIGYNYRIWGAYRASDGWRKLNNSNPHTDHVHFSFTWNGAMKRTSFWTGSVSAEDDGPCRIYHNQPAPLWTSRNTRGCDNPAALPTSLKGATLLWRGSRSGLVTVAQTKLGVSPTTGFFGAATSRATIAFQRSHRLPVTGAIDAQTWFALGMGAGTGSATLTPTSAPATRKTLRVGSKGPVVRRLQAALGMGRQYRTGIYGTKTRTAVRHWQRVHHKRVTGVVSPALQRRLAI